MDDQQYRAQFDARVEFSNGGHLEVSGFRVDVPSPDVTEEQVGQLFVTSLGLLMTERARINSLSIIAEAHKGTRGGPSAAGAVDDRTHLVDLNHVIEAGTITYPGLPGPEISPHITREASRSSYADGTEFAIDRISMLGNTGTYLDTPFHRYDEGHDLSALPLERVADLPAVVVRTVGSGGRAVDEGAVAPFDVRGCAVLLHTGGDRAFGTPAYAHDAPFLTAAATRRLVEQGAVLVGIDSVNIDDLDDLNRPAHSGLLAAGIPIVEHLTNLDRLPPHGARFTATPPRLRGTGTFTVRAFASF